MLHVHTLPVRGFPSIITFFFLCVLHALPPHPWHVQKCLLCFPRHMLMPHTGHVRACRHLKIQSYLIISGGTEGTGGTWGTGERERERVMWKHQWSNGQQLRGPVVNGNTYIVFMHARHLRHDFLARDETLFVYTQYTTYMKRKWCVCGVCTCIGCIHTSM